MFKRMIQDTMNLMPYIRGAVFAIGIILLLISTGLFIYWKKKIIKVRVVKFDSESNNAIFS